MRFALAMAFMLVLACQTTSERVGVGPVKLSPLSFETFQIYLGRTPLVFVVTEDGADPYYIYCSEVGCDPNRAINEALERCAGRYGRPCKIWAIRDEIVWKNPGDWQPTDQEIISYSVERASRAPRERLSHAERQLARMTQEEAYDAYLRAPGHKALAVFYFHTGQILRWGYAYGLESPELAARVANERCMSGLKLVGSVREACRIAEVNGIDVWPVHFTEITERQYQRAQLAPVASSLYSGERRVVVKEDGQSSLDMIIPYEASQGTERLFLPGPSDGKTCEFVSRPDTTNFERVFTMTCGEERFSGQGTVSDSGATLKGRFSFGSGRSATVEMFADEAIFRRNRRL